MMRLTKRALSAFLAFVMVFTMLPLQSWADTTQTSNDSVNLMDSFGGAAPLSEDGDSLKLDSASTVIAVEGTHTFTASLVNAAGEATQLGGSDCGWTSSNDGVATVSGGTVTGVSAGTAKITCTYEGLETSAMVTVTNANYRLVYESNYPTGAKKYIYQNGSTASVGAATNTTVNETYDPGATATVAGGIFTTINYDLDYYEGSDGNRYEVGDTITMNANLTLKAHWVANGNTTEQREITVRYYKISDRNLYVDKTVTATFTSQGYSSATVTFITGNNQDTIVENYDNFYGWTIGGQEYAFNEQVTTTATWNRTWGGGGYWLVEAHPLRAEEADNVVHAQFFIRKASATGFGTADKYYSVGTGTVDTSTFERDYWGEVVSGVVAGADNVDQNVNEYILTSPSAAQIANLMNISLDEASAVRWYVIKNQTDGYHVDGVIYLKDKYWKVEFIDPDSGDVIQTLLVPDSEKIPVSDILDTDDLNTDLREFQRWVDSNGDEANFNNVVTGDMQFTASFKRYSGYTVQHYLQNANNDGYTLDEDATEVKRKETGAHVTADEKTYPGFTYNSGRSTASGTVNSEGTLVLKLYYDRDQYTVTYKYEGTIPSDAAAAPAATKYKQGATVTVAQAPTSERYQFSGWTVETEGVSVDNGQFTMPTKNVTLVGSWEQKVFDGDPITVKVVRDGVPVAAQGVVKPTNLGNTENFKATYGNDVYTITYTYDNLNCADIKLTVTVPEGYSVSVDSNDKSDTVGFDGTTVNCSIKGGGADWSLDNIPGGATVTVTLTKLQYLVRYEADEGGSVSLDEETIVHGGNGQGSTAAPADGYYFVNWTKGDEVVSTDPTYVPKNVTETATYTAHFAEQTAITIKAGDLRKTYDGTAINADGTKYTLVGGELQDGHHIVVTTEVSDAVVNVGDSGEHRIATYHIYDNNNKDVGYLYDVELLPGTLTINPRPVTVTAESYTITYGDETPVFAIKADELEKQLAEGDSITLIAYTLECDYGKNPETGEALVGKYDITFKDPQKEQGNYEVSFVPGIFEVTVNEDAVVDKTHASDHPVYELGDEIEFTITITNIYNEEKSLTVTDLTAEIQDEIPETLAPGETITLTAVHKVDETDIEKQEYTNTVDVKLGDVLFTDSDTVEAEELEDENNDLLVEKSSDVQEAKVGDTIKYTITVTNDGNQTQEMVWFKDELTGTQMYLGKLGPGESQTVTGSYTVTVADLMNGKVTNIAEATNDHSKTYKSNEVTVDVVSEMTLTVTLESGEVVYDGNEHKVSGIKTVEFTLDGKTFANDGGIFSVSCDEDVVTVSGTNVQKDGYALNAGADAFTIMMDSKDVTGNFAGKITVVPGTLTITPRPVTLTSASDTKVYDGTPLTNVVVTPSAGKDEGFVGTDGATYDVTGSQTLVGSSENEFTYELNEGVTASNYAITTTFGTLTVTPPADYDYVQKDHKGENFDVGDIIEFVITVENIYDAEATVTFNELPNVVFKDSNSTQLTATLAAGETKDFIATYEVTQEDVVAGEVENTVTWELTPTTPNPDDPEGVEYPPIPGEDEDIVDDLIYNPHLTVDKAETSKAAAANGEYAVGETITYTITVTNDGNLTANNVSVEDLFTIGNAAPEKVNLTLVTTGFNGTLEPGAAVVYTYSYTVVEEDLGKTIVNAATVTAEHAQNDPQNPIGNITEEDEVVVKVEDPNPQLSIVKTITNPAAEYRVGQAIQYQIVVTNEGNTTEHNLVLVDDLLYADGNVTYTNFGGGYLYGREVRLDTLAPGASWTVTCQYVVREADEGESIVNTATVRSDNVPNTPATTGEADVEVRYGVTIRYVNTAGTAIAPEYYGRYSTGDIFSIDTPTVAGYVIPENFRVISGTMQEEDLIYVIVYGNVPADDDDDEPAAPAQQPDDEDEDEEATEETTETLQPGGYTEDPDDYTLTPIEDDKTPLADMDVGEHTCCIMHFLLMVAAMVVLGFYTKSRKKHQARIFELKRTLAMEQDHPEGDDPQQS